MSWLSVCEFQYRDTTHIYGETLDWNFRADSLPKSSLRTTIGNDVWIGDNVVVIQGNSIGTGSIIGAGSVVTKDVEPFQVVVGNPARFIRWRFDERIRKTLFELKWWERELTQLNGIRFSNIEDAIVDLGGSISG